MQIVLYCILSKVLSGAMQIFVIFALGNSKVFVSFKTWIRTLDLMTRVGGSVSLATPWRVETSVKIRKHTSTSPGVLFTCCVQTNRGQSEKKVFRPAAYFS